MKLLVFQHIACEHPGSLRKFLAADGIEWDAVNLQDSEAIPKLEDYDALWVMGGPMDVWDVDKYPWLVDEKAAIRRWVRELDKPYLGLCLGHQLLADALDGSCGPQQPPEIGVLDINLTGEADQDPLFGNLPATQKGLQWHSVCVDQLPQDATILASSEICKVQAMRVGNHAWSMQYHIEIEADTVANWGQVPEYRKALVDSLGEDGLDILGRDASEHMPGMQQCAEMIYRNFMNSVG